MTLVGRREFERNQNAGAERFLLFQDHSMMVFMSLSDVELFHQSEFIIADGTFEMVPNEFTQLSLHGFYRKECRACLSYL